MSIGIEWTGTDGSVWDLRGGPVRATTAGIKGLSFPDIDFQTQETALLHGQRLTGWKLKPREVWLPLRFKDEAARDVEGVQREFWRSFGIGLTGTLRVTDNLGAVRSLNLRFQDDGGLAYRIDPSILTDAFGITCVADQPWWEGPAQTTFYSLGDTANQTFFGNGAGATPFYILPGQGAASSTISNPGDNAAWVEWGLAGPLTQFRLGVSGRYVGGSVNVGAPNLLTIETDPLRQVAYLDGIKVTRQLSEVDFAPVAPGVTVPVDISVTGLGRITATIKPRYARAL